MSESAKCELLYWRLERVAGAHPGWLLSLMCADEHVHFVAYTPLKEEAERIARAWERETFGAPAPMFDLREQWLDTRV